MHITVKKLLKAKKLGSKEHYLLVDGLRSSRSSKISQSSITIECNVWPFRETIEAAVGIKASAATALTSSSGSSSPVLQAGRTWASKLWSISWCQENNQISRQGEAGTSKHKYNETTARPHEFHVYVNKP